MELIVIILLIVVIVLMAGGLLLLFQRVNDLKQGSPVELVKADITALTRHIPGLQQPMGRTIHPGSPSLQP